MHKSTNGLHELKFFSVAIFSCIALLLALGQMTNVYAHPSIQEVFEPNQPIHHKKIQDNRDGSYKLSLDIDGDARQKQEIKPVDVVLIMDVTRSMTHCMDGQSSRHATKDNPVRMEVAHDAAIKLVDEILGEESGNSKLPENQQTKISLVRFGGDAECNTSGEDGHEPLFTANANTLKKNIDKYINVDRKIPDTDWSEGLEMGDEVLKDGGRPGVDKVIIFMSDGEPNEGEYTSTGDIDKHISGYRYGNWAVQYLKDNENHISGFKQMFNVYCGEDSGDGAKLMGAMSHLLDKCQFLEGKDKKAFDKAFEKIADYIYHKYTFTNVSIHDELSQWADFKLDGDGNISGLRFEEIDKETNTTKEIDGSSNFDFDISNKTLTWKPKGSGDLKKNTRYRVSFDIEPNQDAFDKAAELGREGSSLPDISDKGERGFFSNKVNEDGTTSATMTYSIREKIENSEGILEVQVSDPTTKEYEKPVLNVATSQIEISKVWADGADHTNETVKYEVLQDGDKLLDGTLSADNGWSDTKIVAAGPKGHTYQVKEVSVPAGYICSTKLDDNEFKDSDKVDVEYKSLTQSISHKVVFKNTPDITLSVIKYKAGANTDHLEDKDLISGAEFTLYKNTHPNDDAYFSKEVDATPDNVVATSTTQKGKLELNGLEPGSYWLAETRAPAGYTLINPVRIDIEHTQDENKMWIVEYEEMEGVMQAKERVEINMDGNVGLIKVAEKQVPTLPSSGSSMSALLMFVGSVLVSVATTVKLDKKFI